LNGSIPAEVVSSNGCPGVLELLGCERGLRVGLAELVGDVSVPSVRILGLLLDSFLYLGGAAGAREGGTGVVGRLAQ
jgi:hypothetical protein